MITTKTVTFAERLHELGFVTYDEYLASTFWIDAKLRWLDAGMSEECLICRRPEVNLHHRSYERLGEERFTELVALCEPHHYEVHRLLRKGLPGVTLWDAHLHYRKQQFERRAQQPRLLGEVMFDLCEAING